MTTPPTSLPALALSAVAVGAWVTARRRSPVVSTWQPSRHPVGRHGPLAARAFGSGSHTVLLLHGVGSTSDYWSAGYDRLGDEARVVVPDLLGFGRSIDHYRDSVPFNDHLDAIGQCVVKAAPDTAEVSIVSHATGAALAIEFAITSHLPVRRVICCGPPVQRRPEDTVEAVRSGGPMARLFMFNRNWARRACAVSGRSPALAGLLAAAAQPHLPTDLTRRGALHTWPAYRDTMHNFVLDYDWTRCVPRLRQTTLELVVGSDDRSGDRELMAEMGSCAGNVSLVGVEGAGAHLPITHSSRVLDLLTAPRPNKPGH